MLIPHSFLVRMIEKGKTTFVLSLMDAPAAYELYGEVTAHQDADT